MVCAKCQKKPQSTTALATPEVKKKNDMYYGSPAAGSSKAGSSKAGTKTSATLGNNGIGKLWLLILSLQSKLLSKSARNPYATYSTTCTGKDCSTKIDQGRKYCLKCSYKANACAMCGKPNAKTNAAAPVIAGQKFTLK
ncbi:Cript family protein [Rutstroemia sp. NJR-2017a BBW]|nr:Cript family protein [Rutstroemia sp. NJR-2017a BBW]